MKKPESYLLKLTQAIVMDGAIVRPGRLVEVTEAEAKNLLARGKAELATEDKPADDDDADAAARAKADADAAEAAERAKAAEAAAPTNKPAARKGKAA